MSMGTVSPGRTGMRVVLSGGSVQLWLWPDRSPVVVTVTASEWADVAECAARFPAVEDMQAALDDSPEWTLS